MRETLTGLAIVLIVLLTGALAAPYFVDWNAQRAFVEARLSHALGDKVTIGGNIDLKLLPTPYLVLDQTVIGGDDGPITLGIRHLNLELSVTPLLHGAFEVVEARLDQPTIRVTLTRDRAFPMLHDAPAFNADVRFDRITVVDGTLAIADPLSGRTFAADHLDFEAEVASLAGPFKGGGSAGPGDARTKFRFATTTARDGKTRTKLVLEETHGHAGLDLDGVFDLTDRSRNGSRQTFDGTAVLSGHLRDETAILLPWRLSGPLHFDPLRAALGDGELRLGGEDHNVTLAAAGAAELGETAAVRMTLSGKQIDIDRLFGAGVGEGGMAVKPVLPDLTAVRRALGGAALFLPTTLDVSIESATYAGDALSNVEANFTLGAEGSSPLRLRADAPGRSHVAIDGLVSASTPFYAGAVAIEAGDVTGLKDWLAAAAPGVLDARQEFPFRSMEAKGSLTLGDKAIDARAFHLRLDRSSLIGAAAFQNATGSHPALLQADLKAEALDLDALPDLARLRAATSGFDLDLRLNAQGIKVARFADGPLNAGHIELALTKTGTHLSLDPFRIEGLGGATIDAKVAIDPDAGRIDVNVDAARLLDAAALARRLYPGAIGDGLAARASVLAPAKLKIGATFKARDRGDLVPDTLDVTGFLGGTRVVATLSPEASDVDRLAAKADLTAADAGMLLAQLGLPTLPLRNLGPGHIGIEGRGRLDGPFATAVQATFGTTSLDLAGQLDLASDKPTGSGTLKLTSIDVSPMLQTLALAFPDLMGRLPVEAKSKVALTPTGLSLTDIEGHLAGAAASGSLFWQMPATIDDDRLTGSLVLERLSLGALFGLALGPPQQPALDTPFSTLAFGTGLVQPPKALLDLKVKMFDVMSGLAGRDATLSLDIKPNSVALKHLRATLNEGQATADLTLRRDGPSAAIEGRVALTDVALDLPSAKGRASGSLDLAGSGRSASALVGSLAGTGEVTVSTLEIPRAEPGALSKVFEDVESDRLSVDEDSIVRALDEAAKAPLSAGARAFSLALAAGVVHGAPTAPAIPLASENTDVTNTVTASIDLRKMTIDEKIEQTLHSLPKNWIGPPPQIVLSLMGPLKAPLRSIDISVFINTLATRALARESARIEAYEFDVHERAFFNQRLQADRRREQDRVKAEDDARLASEAAARKVEAERRARENAAKAERLRKEEAARAAARAQAEREQSARERADEDRAAEERSRGRVGQPLPLSGASPEPANNPPPADSAVGPAQGVR